MKAWIICIIFIHELPDISRCIISLTIHQAVSDQLSSSYHIGISRSSQQET